MIIQTYQSKLVLKILRSGETYRAKPNLSLREEYQAMIELLGLHCECPIFGVVKGKRQNTGGKVSGAVRLTLDVPDQYVHLTEYGEWADFLYAFRYTRPGNFRSLRPDCEEITVRRYQEILENLQAQKPLSEYRYPQVVLEKIRPEWLKRAKVMRQGDILEAVAQKVKSIWDFIR